MSEHGDAGSELPRELDAAIDLLREQPEVSDIWRHGLLHRVDDIRHARSRRWSLRPWVVIAACITCLILGGAGALLIARSRPAEQAVTTVRFSFAAPAAAKVSVVG